MKELLLLLCHYPYTENSRDQLTQLLVEVRDWPSFITLINSHGIIALASYNIKEAGLERIIPKDIMAALENGYLQSVVRNIWLTEQWKEVNTILFNAGIQHILLKGMALEHTIYDSKGLRQMTDNDILLTREDSIRAWHLLQKNGFAHELIKSPLHKKILLDTGKHLPTLTKNGYTIELHHKLFDYKKDFERYSFDAFSGARDLHIYDTKAMILSEELQKTYLLNHFTNHMLAGDCQIRQYADLLILYRENLPDFPNRFITDPFQGKKEEFRKAAYRAIITSIQKKYRLRYIIGDIFPSIKWMKKRYRCGGLKALIIYPLRIGKLGWIIH